MALRWVVHTACHVLGYQNNNDTIKCKNVVGSFHDQTDQQAIMKKKSTSTKVSGNGGYPSGFQMPLHYPRHSKADYETMEEWRIDLLLGQYGLSFDGSLDEKRAYLVARSILID